MFLLHGAILFLANLNPSCTFVLPPPPPPSATFSVENYHISRLLSDRRDSRRIFPPSVLRLSKEAEGIGDERASADDAADEPLYSRRKRIKAKIRRAADRVFRSKTTAAEIESEGEEDLELDVLSLVEESIPRPDLIGRVLEDAAMGVAEEVVRMGREQIGTMKDQSLAQMPTKTGLEVEEESNVAVDDLDETLTEDGPAVDPVPSLSSSLQTFESSSVVDMNADLDTVVGPATPVDFTDCGENIHRANFGDLSYDDVDYQSLIAEAGDIMEVPFLDEDQCLVPGEAVVRIEDAPGNARRIFAGIDIRAKVDDIWKLLTDYENLQKCVPNLVTNEVLELYDSSDVQSTTDDVTSLSRTDRTRTMSSSMRGAKLRQVGGAKVVGITFSARTTLEVREWPNGLPSYAIFDPVHVLGSSTKLADPSDRTRLAEVGRKTPLERYVFPRPFAVASLPTHDITMQSVENDDGEFRMYQGVWRMQPLPGCVGTGEDAQDAMRLTYAVEVAPRPYLPVRLIENRIALDLCSNLKAIRDYVAANNT